MAPCHLCCLHVVRDHVIERTRLAGLGNGERARMFGQEGRGNAGEHQTGQHGDGQDVLLDLLAALGLGGAKDDALDLVVYAAACLESVQVGGAGEVVEVRLEEPECLGALAWGRVCGVVRRRAHQQSAVDRLLAQVYYELLQGHRLVVDANEQMT